MAIHELLIVDEVARCITISKLSFVAMQEVVYLLQNCIIVFCLWSRYVGWSHVVNEYVFMFPSIFNKF